MQTQIRVAAQHWMFKLAQYGSVSGYEEAAIEYAEVVAVMDSKTTEICRRMHGRIIPVSKMRNQLDRAIGSGDSLEGMKKAHPMISQQDWAERLSKLTSTKSLNDSGACMPPYHFNCRTRTVAYFDLSADRQCRGGFKGYSRTKGERAKDPGLTDQEIKNFSDELGRRVKENKMIVPEKLFDYHFEKHGSREMGLSREEYAKSQIETIRNAKERAVTVYQEKNETGRIVREAVQYQFWDGKRVTIVEEGFRIVQHHGMSEKRWQKIKTQELFNENR